MSDDNGTRRSRDSELARHPITWRLMGHGYWRAFNRLWAEVQTEGHEGEDLELIPLVFLLRHSLELMLKSGIARIAERRPTVNLGQLCRTHDLTGLKATIDRHAPAAIASEIAGLITALVQLDPTGYEFRYPSNTSFDELSNAWSGSPHETLRNVCALGASLRGPVHAIETRVRRALNV